jgi:hypothetical protein
MLRAAPWGTVVTQVPEGTPVQVLAAATAPEPGGGGSKTWYQVQTTVGSQPTTGWMHQDVLAAAPAPAAAPLVGPAPAGH